jgi:hypothetical protein
MPRTTYRFRVSPLIISEPDAGSDEPKVEQGEWSEISNIATKDNQSFDIQGTHCATLISKTKNRWLNFDKAGTMLS